MSKVMLKKLIDECLIDEEYVELFKRFTNLSEDSRNSILFTIMLSVVFRENDGFINDSINQIEDTIRDYEKIDYEIIQEVHNNDSK